MKTEELSLSWYDVPIETKRLLLAAAEHWDDRSQDYMHQAIAGTDSLDVLVAAYRYFFYRHDDEVALQIALQIMQQIRELESLPEDWEQLQPILSSRRDDSLMRLYLNAYAASGLVLARLGELDRAKQITAAVSAIDPKRESCAATVLSILTQPAEEDL